MCLASVKLLLFCTEGFGRLFINSYANYLSIGFAIVYYLSGVYSPLHITFGGMCMLPQLRGGACFCTRGAMQDYDVDLFVLALAKTVTPRGVPRGSGAGRLVFARRLQPPSRADQAPTGFGVLICRISAQKPAAAIAYTDLLGGRAIFSNYLLSKFGINVEL
jgi:hypothetical protein